MPSFYKEEFALNTLVTVFSLSTRAAPRELTHLTDKVEKNELIRLSF